MVVLVRALARAFIKTKPDVDKKSYLEDYAAQTLLMMPYRPYSDDTILDRHVDIWRNHHPVEQLLEDSKLTTNIPLAFITDSRAITLEELPHEVVENIHGYYPLVKGESITTIKMLYLEHDWEGLERGTFFFERETNFSQTYFALPDFRWNLETGKLLPPMLSKFDPEAKSDPSSSSHLQPHPIMAVAMANATATSESDPSKAMMNNMVSLSLDTISTLSWATPAGPFVSAGIGILQVILNSVFGEEKVDLLESIRQVGDDIVREIKQFQQEANLMESIDAVKVFSAWIAHSLPLLNTQSPETYMSHMTQENGILGQLNKQLGSDKNSLFYLITTLSENSDLNAGDAYGTPHDWLMANYKLHLLFFVISQYLTALKLKIVLLARLHEFGYDVHGNQKDPHNLNPDNTFSLLVSELKEYKNLTPKIIANVRSRRAAMITLETASCKVAYSKLLRPVGERNNWVMNEHDALYRGPKHDQLVRATEDNPSTDHFESYRVSNALHTHSTYYVHEYYWERTEIRDKVIYNGKNPQDFVLHNGDWWSASYEVNTERAEVLKAKYLADILQEFDTWAKVPEILGEAVTSLQAKWTPQLPEHFPDSVGLSVKEWGGTAEKNELWFNPHAFVRYRISLRGTGGESSLSNDRTSTLWEEPKQRNRPKITGFPTGAPTTGDPTNDLTYVQTLVLHRGWKVEYPDGFKVSEDRPIAVLRRDVNNKFPDIFVDTVTTKHDEATFTKMGNK